MHLFRYGLCLGATLLGSALLIATHTPAATAADHAASAKTAHSKKGVPTFNKDIAPIVFNHCTSCHRTGQAAPFTLMNYHDAKARGQLLATITKSGQMPPWKPGKGDCALKDENRLTDSQIDLLARWVATGMKEGNPADLPPRPAFVAGWQLGKPDLIVKMDRSFHVPADGPDIYRTFVVPLNLPEDKWVTAIEYHPQSRTVVHHCLFFYDTTGMAREQDGKDGQPGIGGGMGPRVFGGGGHGGGHGDGTGSGRMGGSRHGGGLASIFGGGNKGGGPFGSLGGWAVGAQPRMLPEGLAYALPEGSDLILSTHFHMSGKAEEEASEVGLYFAKKPPEKEFTVIQLPPVFGALSGLNIPVGEKDYTLKDSFVLPVDVKAFGIAGHAHFIASDMKLTATLPDGQTKTMLWIPKWDFAWQGQYQYKQFESLPKGTRLDVVIHYDNSSDNPRNPNSPPQRVHWGEQSTNEMGSMLLSVVATNEQEMPMLREAYAQHLRGMFKGMGMFGGFGDH